MGSGTRQLKERWHYVKSYRSDARCKEAAERLKERLQ